MLTFKLSSLLEHKTLPNITTRVAQSSICLLAMTAAASFPTTINIGGKASAADENKKVADVEQHRFEVVSSEPMVALSSKFSDLASSQSDIAVKTRRSGWAGADAAYSIPIDKDNSLWMFGDTFIRSKQTSKKSKNGVTMINNSAAIMQADGSLKFHWHQTSATKPESSLITSPTRKTWLWPLAGIVSNGTLYEFVNQIESVKSDIPGFGFAPKSQLLMKVTAHLDSPEQWNPEFQKLQSADIQFGDAVILKDKYLYVFCSFHPSTSEKNKHQQIIARIQSGELSIAKTKGGQRWEFWCMNPQTGKSSWVKPTSLYKVAATNPVVIIPDGAPEFSVTQIQGFDGYFAVYFPSGFGSKIVMRHAESPEGPWSDPQPVYECKFDPKKYLVYAAKTHQELSHGSGELIITYCQNIKGTLSEQDTPELYYFPHAVRVKLRTSH